MTDEPRADIHARVPSSLYARLRREAARIRRSINWTLAEVLDEGLRRREEEHDEPSE